jgi:D-alanyl-D-alanine carboxypeptidase
VSAHCRTLAAALVVAGGLFGISTRAAAQASPLKAEVARVVDSLARQFITDHAHGSPAVSIAVVRGTDTLVINGWGRADVENGVPATAQTVYRIGSITQQFTSAAVMQLVEAGKVKTDDSIGTYLPTLPVAWRVVTARQLLDHTSGIPSYTDIGQRWVRRWGEEMPPDTLIALTAHDTLWFKPGTSWRLLHRLSPQSSRSNERRHSPVRHRPRHRVIASNWAGMHELRE